VRAAAPDMAAAVKSAGDDGLRAAILNVCAEAGVTEALPTVEALITDTATGPEVKTAALNAAARLWAINGGATGNTEELGKALLALVEGGDAALALPASEALGQLRGLKDTQLSSAVQ
jgi:hypothetical protein